METCTMLTLSTAHIEKETAEMLKHQSVDSDLEYDTINTNLVVYSKADYGWWIHVADLDRDDVRLLPCDLAACCMIAMRENCEWLCLDADGPIEDCLPMYEW